LSQPKREPLPDSNIPAISEDMDARGAMPAGDLGGDGSAGSSIDTQAAAAATTTTSKLNDYLSKVDGWMT